MTFELEHLFFAGVIYLLLLFFIAYATDEGWIPRGIARHPATSALSLGVYATSWSFYGSVGFAHSNGFNFLSIYLGATLAFLLVPVLLAPLLRLVREYQLTSLADLLAFRYHSQATGVLVTLFMLVGTVPYLALQILAVTESIQILTREVAPHILALGFCATLTLFAILFGARHTSPREKHEGLVVAIAFESLVKLAALCAVGFYALFGIFGGLDGLNAWLVEHPEALERLYAPVREGPWTTLLFLSFAAAFLLPRQFHMTFTENLREGTLFTAAWAFPLFLLALNLFIPVILWAGRIELPDANPDFHVLGITLGAGSGLLPAFAFLGGLSAASAMMIVTTLALSSMCLNHLVLPARYRGPYLTPEIHEDLYERLRFARRLIIGVVVLAGYLFFLLLQRNQGLVELGLISFVAVAQFLPGVVGTLFWSGATRSGFVAGLAGGATVWGLTLLAPLLHRSGLIELEPATFQLLSGAAAGADGWSFATFLSLAVNFGLFAVVSLLSRQRRREVEAMRACRQSSVLPFRGGLVIGAESAAGFTDRLARILGTVAAEQEVAQALADLDMSPDEENPSELRRLREQIERNLSGLMGPILARMIVDERLQTDPGTRSALADNVRQIEGRLGDSELRLQGVAADLDQLRRYHRNILQALPLGVCAIDRDGSISTWNDAMERLSDIDRRAALGSKVERLPEPWGTLLRLLAAADATHQPRVPISVDGQPRWLSLHKTRFDATRGFDRETGGMALLVEDQTEYRKLEGESAHNERLASIGRFAAGAAHEIGNPITGIASIAQNLARETGEPATRESSETILDQTRRVAAILRSLVAFSHGEAPPAAPAARLDVRSCVEEAVRLVALDRDADSAGATAESMRYVNRCPERLSVIADRPGLLQVLVNLLVNARDASGGAGPVAIEARGRDGTVEIDVIDRGSGMDSQTAGQAFEPFFTTKPAGEGTGLGLSLAYRIVRSHGGAIDIRSRAGEGTRVRVILPRVSG